MPNLLSDLDLRELNLRVDDITWYFFVVSFGDSVYTSRINLIAGNIPVEECFEYDFQLLQAENSHSKHSSTGDVRPLNCGLFPLRVSRIIAVRA